MHTLESEHAIAAELERIAPSNAGEKILGDLARGMDAIFGATRVCSDCGMTVPADPMKHWHDDPRPDTRAHDDMLRESGEASREETQRRRP